MPRPLAPALLLAPIVLAPALLAPAAHAQIVEVYGTFSPLHLSNVQTGSVYTSTGYQNQTTSFWAPGVGGGVTVNFLNLHVVKLGFDFRGSVKPGTNGADTALFGLKLGFNPPLLHLKPYLQASGGYVASRTHNVSTSFGSTGSVGGTFGNQYAAYEILGGIDYPLVHFVDLRLIEIGAGSGIGVLTSYNPTLFTANTGLVLHF